MQGERYFGVLQKTIPIAKMYHHVAVHCFIITVCESECVTVTCITRSHR